MSFILKNEGHAGIKLDDEQATYLLKSNGIPASKLCAIKEFNESAQLHNGATICWSNNAGD